MQNTKQYLKSLLGNYLVQEGIDIKHNFSCLNPMHNDKTPSMTYYPDNQTVHCHGCNATFDIFDLFAIQHLHVTPDSYNHLNYQFKNVWNHLVDYMHVDINHLDVKPEDEEQNKINEFNHLLIKQASTQIDQTDYLKKRGISQKLAQRFHIGYVKNWINPTVAIKEGINTPPTPRIIIPTGTSSYLARDTRYSIPRRAEKYIKVKQGALNLFNVQVLSDDTKPIFITEGEFDALSIMEVTQAAEAVALGSTSNINSFIQTVKKIKSNLINEHKAYYPVFLIATDNDPAGKLAARKIQQGLNNINIENHIVNISFDCKDPNEALTTNREKFTNSIISTIKDPDDYLNHLLERIKERKDNPQYVPTGFKQLDNILDGGLYPQLYVIGAVSSLGKTTFVMQIADRIASRQHRPVFIFSLETSKDELTEKNISRLTYEISNSNTNLAQTARSINNGDWLDNTQAKALVEKSFIQYGNYYTLLHIFDGTRNRPSAKDIFSRLNAYCSKHADNKPVVIVDYLQILKPLDDRDTDKEKVTKSIAEFKKIATTFELPVIVISSFNRASYQTQASMESFKESGEIEYYSDTLIGLQYSGMDRDVDLENLKRKDPRDITVKILKNRNGRSGTEIKLSYYPKYNFFIGEE